MLLKSLILQIKYLSKYPYFLINYIAGLNPSQNILMIFPDNSSI